MIVASLFSFILQDLVSLYCMVCSLIRAVKLSLLKEKWSFVTGNVGIVEKDFMSNFDSMISQDSLVVGKESLLSTSISTLLFEKIMSWASWTGLWAAASSTSCTADCKSQCLIPLVLLQATYLCISFLFNLKRGLLFRNFWDFFSYPTVEEQRSTNLIQNHDSKP